MIEEESNQGPETREGTVSKITDGSRVSSNAEGPAPVSQVTFVQNQKSMVATPPTETADQVSTENTKVSTPVQIPTEVRDKENTPEENIPEDQTPRVESRRKSSTPRVVSRQQSRLSLAKSVAEELQEEMQQQEPVPESLPESARGSILFDV